MEGDFLKMNKRAEIGDVLMDPVIYIILVVVFTAMMFYFVSQYNGAGALWEDYYAKEIVKVVNFANVGDKIQIDVHRATEVAKANNVRSFSEIFKVDNKNNEICVKLNRGRKTCYSYFNDVDIVNLELKLLGGRNEKNEEVNVLSFGIGEKQKIEEVIS